MNSIKNQSLSDFVSGLHQSRRSLDLRLVLIAALFLSSLASFGCGPKKPPVARTEMSACRDRINSIKGLASALREREENRARSLEGLELALTITDFVHREDDEEDDVDDWCSSKNGKESFEKLSKAIKQTDLPPTVSFFVGDKLDPAILEHWLKKGNLAGNMTFSWIKIRDNDADRFIQDVAQNDKFLAPYLAKYGQKQKYFRYPRLKPSRDAAEGAKIRASLRESGYIEASATIDAVDHLFSEIYCEAQSRNDEKCATLVKEYFKSFLLDTTLKSRAVSSRMAGREVKQILSLRASQLVVDSLSDLVSWYRSMGAKFISLDQALSDPFYQIVDDDEKNGPQAVVREVIRARRWEKE